MPSSNDGIFPQKLEPASREDSQAAAARWLSFLVGLQLDQGILRMLGHQTDTFVLNVWPRFYSPELNSLRQTTAQSLLAS